MAQKKQHAYRFEIFKSDINDQFYWRMVTNQNGNIVSQSEGYTRRGSAKATVIKIAQCFKSKPEIRQIDYDGVTIVSY